MTTIADELREVLTAAAAEHGVPGATAGLLIDGGTHTACVGVTSVDDPLPVTDTTLFQVASITKTFVATAVMTLVEQGVLELDDPVSKHMPDLATRTGLDADAITVEHLLSHQAGFDGDHLFVGRVPENLEQLTTARRLFAPGTGVSYCNGAFSIAGELIATVSDQPFERFVRDHLLKPLGIKAYFTANEVVTRRVAAPHYVIGDRVGVLRGTGFQNGWELGPVDRPAGGLITSVAGLLAWAQLHLGPGGNVLSRAALDRMQQPASSLDRWTDYGLDWSITRSNAGTVLDHGGLNAGYCSALVFAPEQRVAIVSLTHATNGGNVNQAIRRWALERFAGILERDHAPDPSVTIDAARFCGRFLQSMAQLTIEPGAAPNTLRVTFSQRDDVEGWKPPAEAPMTLAFVDDRHAVSIDAVGPQRVTQFGFGDDGRAAWMTWAARRAVRNDERIL